MDLTRKQGIAAELKALEKDYRHYLDPTAMLGLEASVLRRLWDVFGSSVIKPEAAPFVIGRMYEAFEPYREALFTIKRYEELEAKLAGLGLAEERGEASTATGAPPHWTNGF